MYAERSRKERAAAKDRDDTRSADSDRKLALDELNKYKHGSRTSTSNKYEHSSSRDSVQSAKSYTKAEAPRRLPIDGYLRLGSAQIEWRPPVLPITGWPPTHPPWVMKPVLVMPGGPYGCAPYGQCYPPYPPYPNYPPPAPPEVHHHHHYYDGDDGEQREPTQRPASPPPPPPQYYERESFEPHAKYDMGLEDHDEPPPPQQQQEEEEEEEEAPPSHAMPALDSYTPRPLAQFRAALDCGDAHNERHRERRTALWHSFDSNANGYVCLAETCGGVLQVLCNMWGKEGQGLFDRYYRSYIRAFSDAKDAAKAKRKDDDDYVTRSEFRLLIRYLGIYATWYEVFMAVDGGTDGITAEDGERMQRLTHTSAPSLLASCLSLARALSLSLYVYTSSSLRPWRTRTCLLGSLSLAYRECADHRISRDEFIAALPKIVQAGRTWANSLAFANATADSFEQMDQNRGGIIDLQEFCEWAESAEKLAHTEQGADLGVNEPIDRPAYGAHRNWHTSQLEMRGVDRRKLDAQKAAMLGKPHHHGLPHEGDHHHYRHHHESSGSL